MAIIDSPYKTRVCAPYKTTKITDALSLAQVQDKTVALYSGRVHVVEVDNEATSMIPSFVQPIVIERDGVKNVFIDMRALTTFDPRSHSVRIRNRTEYEAKIMLGTIIADWCDGRQESFLVNYPVCLSVFSTMIGESVAGRGIDALTQLRISIIAAIHYMNCFTNAEQQESRDYKARLISMITRHCGYRGDEVNAIVDEYYNINGLDDFCEAVKSYTQNRRLDDLNVSVLIDLTSKYWFNNTGAEQIAVSLEYPPVWMYLVYMSFTDRSYRNARLTSITDRNSFKRNSEGFIRAMLARIGSV